MAKKRIAESDAESDNAPPKRARVDDPPAITKSNLKGKKAAQQKESGPPASSDEENGSNDERDNGTKPSQRRRISTRNDEEFEKINAERVKKAMTQKQATAGVAEAGVISRLELHNFMCHKYVTFPFGPQVNFIIGHNGSGKSAALSAITVALGGKATSTGRAAGLKSFIMTGETAAEVTITLKNGGHEPFRPEAYGTSIVITRSFTQNGSSSYKIKNQHGKLVSNKRDELSAILDHFLIDVDNPMNILTQDLARQFLSASNSTEKYNLFLKGTLLTQLKEEYDLIRENCSKTKAVLGKKKESIDELEMRYKDAEARHQKAQNLADAQDAIKEIKREMAWAHVAEKEGELEAAISKTSREKERLAQIQVKLDEAQQQVIEAGEKINDAEIRISQAASPDELTDQLSQLNAELTEGKEELRLAMSDAKEAGNELKAKKQALKEAEKLIEEEQAKLERDAEREEIKRRIDEAQRTHNGAKEAHEKAVVDAGRAKEAAEAHKRQLAVVEREFNQMQDSIMEAESKLRNAETLSSGTGRSGPALYGQHMPSVLRAIGSTRWRGQKPVGPLGLYVRLKENRWADALRVGIGNHLGGFAVTDYQDRATLRKILDDNGARFTSIVVAEPDLYDFSAGEPPRHLTTVLRVLEISNDWVVRILINNARIERLLLAETRLDGEALLKDFPQFTAWTADCVRVQRFADGGGTTAPIGGRIGNDYRSLLFTENREKEVLVNAQNELREAKSRYDELFQRRKQAQEVSRAADAESGRAAHLMAQCLQRARATNQALEKAKGEDVQEKPIDLAAQEAVAEELRASIEQLERVFEAAMATKKSVNARNKPTVERAKEVREQIKQYEQRQQEIGLEAEEAAGEHMRAQRSENHYKMKLEEQQAEVAKASGVERQVEAEYMRWRAEVEGRYAEFKDPRPLKNLEKKLKAKEASLQRGQEEQGQTLEDIISELARAKLACDKAQQEFRDMIALVNLLRRSLATRMQTWQHFRQHMSLRCKLSFQYYLSLRGFFGHLVLDHDRSSLTLQVQTDDQKSKNGKSREKDAKSMSGGEKSFATICLLLSLWDAMGCPIRALDEFDVYMDAVNRRISMKMMLDAAKNSDKQHILITPQDMGTVQPGPEVRVHRMNDPERGQQTLAFQ